MASTSKERGAVYCYECQRIVDVPVECDAEAYCEDCGDHQAWRCPHCGETIDSVREDLIRGNETWLNSKA